MVPQIHLHANTPCIICGANRWHNVPSVTRVIRSLFEPACVVRCGSCGLGRLEPLPARAAVEAVYSSDLYARSYDFAGQEFVISEETATQQLATRFARLNSYLPLKGNLLDIGASRGIFLNQARVQGWSIFGLEAGIDTIEYAQRQWGIHIQHGTLEETTLTEAFYDCVHLSHVLEHLLDPPGSMQRIVKAMKTGGVLIVEVPFEFGDMFDWFRELALRRPRALNEVPSSHLYFFTLRSLCRLLSGVGFEILHATTPRRNQSFESMFPMGRLFKQALYNTERVLKMGPLLEVFARKK